MLDTLRSYPIVETSRKIMTERQSRLEILQEWIDELEDDDNDYERSEGEEDSEDGSDAEAATDKESEDENDREAATDEDEEEEEDSEDDIHFLSDEQEDQDEQVTYDDEAILNEVEDWYAAIQREEKEREAEKEHKSMLLKVKGVKNIESESNELDEEQGYRFDEEARLNEVNDRYVVMKREDMERQGGRSVDVKSNEPVEVMTLHRVESSGDEKKEGRIGMVKVPNAKGVDEWVEVEEVEDEEAYDNDNNDNDDSDNGDNAYANEAFIDDEEEEEDSSSGEYEDITVSCIIFN